MSDLLSQNEIDALLHGAGDPAPKIPVSSSTDYELYDLTSGMHRVQGWANDVKIVDERIQTNLSIRLLGLLHKSVEVKRQDIQILKYGEYIKSLYVPTSINTFSLTDMVGYSAIVLDAKLVYALVNVFFGGGSRPIQIEGREFTHTEQRVIKLILGTIIDAIKNSWKELSDVEFMAVETEMNPAHLSAYSDTDVLMIRPFKVEFSGGGGEVQLLMPGTVVDSIFRNRKSKNPSEGMTVKKLMRARAANYVTNVTGELSGARLTIGEIFKLSKGDIISVDSPEEVDVKVNGVAKFKARMGEVNGKVGLKILSN
jgi:flagellar motor switch protein FliM